MQSKIRSILDKAKGLDLTIKHNNIEAEECIAEYLRLMSEINKIEGFENDELIKSARISVASSSITRDYKRAIYIVKSNLPLFLNHPLLKN